MTAPNPFEDLDEATLRAGSGLKWHAHDDDVLPMWVAEMDARPAPAVVAAVTSAMEAGNTGYPHGRDYAEAMAAFARARWGWEFDPARTLAVADVMTGIREAIAVLGLPGDPVVVTPPVYGPFFDVVDLADRVRLEAPLGPDRRLDLGGLDRVLGIAAARARGSAVLLLCSPHNPTGVVHTRDELTAVAALANRHGVRVVVDEIHAPLTRPGVEFTPWLTVPGAEAGVSVLSASKGWNLAALKAGLVVGGVAAADDIAAVPKLVTHGPSHMGLIAQTAALDDATDWLDDARQAIHANLELLARLLAERVPMVHLTPPEATYLAWLDFRDTGLGDDPAAALRGQGRLALTDGLFFGTGGAGHARMNVATHAARVIEAVDRIAEVVHRRVPGSG